MYNKPNHNDKKVVLIEFYPYHSELIYSQLLFLNKSNLSPLFICDAKNSIDKISIKELAEVKTYNFEKFSSLIKLWYFIHNSNIKYVIINTAQGPSTLKFLFFPFFKKLKFIGIIHNTEKLQTSLGQKIITNKINNYFVLAKYIKYHFPKIKKLKCESINCSYTEHYDDELGIKQKNEIWIGVPGSIEYKRRNYHFLLEIANHPLFPQNIKIVLLGNASKFQGPEFIANIKKQKLESKFIIFDQFVPNNKFYLYMKNIDYLFPLIHPDTPSSQAYLKSKVSGTFLQSSTYSKPMICHNMFNNELFSYSAKFYSSIDELINILNNNIGTTAVQNLDFEQDRKIYFNFLVNS